MPSRENNNLRIIEFQLPSRIKPVSLAIFQVARLLDLQIYPGSLILQNHREPSFSLKGKLI